MFLDLEWWKDLIWKVGTCLVLSLLIVALMADPAQSVTPFPGKRGVGYTYGQEADLGLLGLDWYRRWQADPGCDGECPEIPYSPTIQCPKLDGTGHVSPVYLEELRAEALRNPGAWWIVFNEPEGTGPGQCTVSVADALVIWPEVRGAILGADPSARFVFGNVLWECFGQGGAWWLEEFVAGRPQIVREIDAWGVHLYVEQLATLSEWYGATYSCPAELDMAKRFLDAVDETATWGKAHGQLPIVLTEMGNLRPLGFWGDCQFAPPWLRCRYQDAMMRRVLPRLDADPGVLGYAWFATGTDSCEVEADWCERCEGSLLEPDGGLTELGSMFAQERHRVWLPIVTGG